jgi:hypothetical protein
MRLKKAILTSTILTLLLFMSVVGIVLMTSACGQLNDTIANKKHTNHGDVHVPDEEVADIDSNSNNQDTLLPPEFIMQPGAGPIRTEMMRQVIERGLSQEYTSVRQKHVQGESPDGIPNDGCCDNSYYFLIDGQRLCSSCAYVFTQEQNRAMGLN